MSDLYELGHESDTPPPPRPSTGSSGGGMGDPAPVFAPPPPPAEVVRQRNARRTLLHGLGFLIAMGLLLGGLALRWSTWRWFAHANIQHGDAALAFDVGDQVVRGGVAGATPDLAWRPFLRNYLSHYRTIVVAHPDGDYGMDVAPLHLLVDALWARHAHVLHPDLDGWVPDYRFNAPLLMFTTACELMAAIGLFVLVRHWTRRSQAAELGLIYPSAPTSEIPWVCGLIAAALLWYNLALLLDGHVWGESDTWLLPFYIFAAWFGSIGRWFWAGVLVAMGCLFKAQLLFVVPLFVLWPLCAGRPLAALRALLGFAAVGAIFLSPWLIHRDMSWARVAIAYGLHRFPRMTIDASNLSAIMATKSYNWSLTDTVWDIRFSKPHVAYAMSVRAMLIAIYALCLLLSAAGAALHLRRNSSGVLAALVAPWAVLFAVLPQMQPRYFVWAAALSAAMAGVSLGMTLLHLVVTVLAAIMMLRQLLPLNPQLAPKLTAALSGLHPHIAWAVLLCAAIFLYEALALPRRRNAL